MAFHFPLDTVLRVRQGLEHQQELLLSAANHRVTLLEEQAQKLNATLAADMDRERQQMTAGMSAAELQFELRCRCTLLERRHALEKDVAEARAARDSQAANFRRARQQREAVETLRQHNFQLYRRLETRNQQRQIDEFFLLLRHQTKQR